MIEGLVAAGLVIGLWWASGDRGLGVLVAWRPAPGLARAAQFTAAGLTVLLVVDEVGLLLMEWSLPTGPLGFFRGAMGLRGVSHVLYLANLTLVAPATHALLKEHAPPTQDAATVEQQARLNMTLVLMFVALTLLITSVQALVWADSGSGLVSLPALMVLSLFAAVLLRVGTAAGRLQAVTVGDHTPLERLHRWHVWLLLMGIVLLQTMVTKAALLLVLIPRARLAVTRTLRRLLPALPSAESPLPVTIEDLARRVRGAELAKVAGFYFLLTSGFSSLLMWQSHAGPFPPAGSGYPMTQTIGTLYTLDILVVIWAIVTPRAGWRTIGPAMGLMAFTRHVLPLVAPGWFTPATTPPGFNPVAALGEIFGGPAAAAVVSFLVHVFTFALFVTQERALRHSDAALLAGRDESLRLLFGWSMGMELCFLSMMLLLSAVLFTAQFPLDHDIALDATTARQAVWERFLIHIVLVAGQAVYAVATLTTVGQLYRRGRSQPDQVLEEVRRRRGPEGLARYYAAIPTARRFGRDRPERGPDRLLVLYAACIVVMVGGAVVTLVRG